MTRCEHCGHPVDRHAEWDGDRDTRDMLAAIARFCHDCGHPTCLHAVELVTEGVGV